ncbi:hypothetical protein E5288_WYG006024 [Bos mutus]|uniref:Uncharacterized protein n=1 Tax=Bos mutus TaxID=72004 RepID=A0A6B0QVT4_9CETA|nr:hypothetical protein [Bos mutus]
MTDMRSKSQFWDFGGTSKKSNVLFWVCRNEHSELQRASPPEEGLLLKLPQETYDSTSSAIPIGTELISETLPQPVTTMSMKMQATLQTQTASSTCLSSDCSKTLQLHPLIPTGPLPKSIQASR